MKVLIKLTNVVKYFIFSVTHSIGTTPNRHSRFSLCLVLDESLGSSEKVESAVSAGRNQRLKVDNNNKRQLK
jgi:hypothetical protein